MVSSRPTLYLIDGSAYIYRAFFALPALNNSKGLQTNAVYGFTTTLMKIIREHQPHGLAVVFDEAGPTLRHEAYKAYKAQRPPMPEGMSAQIPFIHRIVEALNIPVVRQAGYEADDLIGTLGRPGGTGWVRCRYCHRRQGYVPTPDPARSHLRSGERVNGLAKRNVVSASASSRPALWK